MNKILAALFLAMLSIWFAIPALADTSTTVTASATEATSILSGLPASAAPLETTPGTSLPVLSSAPEAVPVGDLIEGVVRVVGDWKSLGWMGGLSALVALLLLILRRVPPVKRLLSRGPAWLVPVLGAGLGAMGGFLGGWSTGGLPAALAAAVAGLGAGLGATGAHQMLGRATADGQAEVNVVRALKGAIHAVDAHAADVAAPKVVELAKVLALKDKIARLAGLARLANGGR